MCDVSIQYRYEVASHGNTSKDWAKATFTGIDKIQYENTSSVFVDAPSTMYVLKDTTVDFRAIKKPSAADWPSGKPVWGGTSGATGTSETTTVTFSTLSTSLTDFKTVTAECGNTITKNVVVFELTGVFTPVDNFSSRSTSSYGLEEIVSLSHATDPTGVPVTVAWTQTSGVGSMPTPTSYDAGPTAGSVTLKAQIASAGPCLGMGPSYTKSVVAPSGVYMTRYPVQGKKEAYGLIGVGIALYYWITPKDVSFSNLKFGEGAATPTTTGFYSACAPFNSYPNGTPFPSHAANGPVSISGGNIATGCRVVPEDHSSTGVTVGPYAVGTLTWNIPAEYITSAGRVGMGVTTQSKKEYFADGSAKVTKDGISDSAQYTGPTTPYPCGCP